MSIVIATIEPDKMIMVGDTQLNHKNKGALQTTATKVFIFDDHTLVGVTGDYDSYIKSVNDLNKIKTPLTFEEKIRYMKQHIQKPCINNNVIISSIENNVAKVFVMGNEYGYNSPTEYVTDGVTIRILMPPGITEDMCKPYIMSPLNLKTQLYSCIKAVSNLSETVNDKIMGFEFIGNGFKLLTENIKYEDIDCKLNLRGLI